MATKVFRRKSPEKKVGWVVILLAIAAFGFAVFFGYIEMKKTLFGSAESMKWFMGFAAVGASIGAVFSGLGLRGDCPRIEVSSGEVVFFDMMGRKVKLALAEYGPACVFETRASPKLSIPSLGFYTAKKEAALRDAGTYQPPGNMTSDNQIQLSYLAGEEGLPTPQEIADAINAARLPADAEAEAVCEDEAQRLLKTNEKRLGRQTFWNKAVDRVILPVGVFAFLMIEFLMDRALSWTAIAIAFAVAAFKFLFDYLADSTNKWVQIAQGVIGLILVGAIVVGLGMVAWWLYEWYTGI